MTPSKQPPDLTRVTNRRRTRWKRLSSRNKRRPAHGRPRSSAPGLRASRTCHGQCRLHRRRARAAGRLQLRGRRYVGSQGATANQAWIFNQIGGNLTGILIILLGLGLWRALSPDLLGRIGAGAVMLTGLGQFLIGFFPLDCRGIDPGCTNDSWNSRRTSGTIAFLTWWHSAAPLILAFAFRRIPEWRGAWLPSPRFRRDDRGRRALLCPRRWCVTARWERDVGRVACPRCALDPNGKCTLAQTSDRVRFDPSVFRPTPASRHRRRMTKCKT